MSEQLYILKWNCHSQTLNENLPIFLENDIFTDVTLSVGARHVRAHKVILAMCSVYFLQLFQEIQTTHPVVFLHSVTYDEVKAILSFMYKGQCIVSEEQLPSVLSVAKLLKIQGLCDMKVPQKTTRPETKIEDKISNTENENPHCDKYFSEQDEKLTNCHSFVSMYDYSYENSQRITHHDISNQTNEVKETVNGPKTPPDLPKDLSSNVCKCFLCGKYLSNQYNLRVHMETHQESFHACQSCPHVSRSRDALRKHVSYRHPEEYLNRKRKRH